MTDLTKDTIIHREMYHYTMLLFNIYSFKNLSAANDNENGRFLNNKPLRTCNVARIFAGYSILNISYDPIKTTIASVYESVVIIGLYSITME